MHTKQFKTVEEANAFIIEMSAKDVSLDAYQDDNKMYVVSWVENKKYTAQDGNEFTDEVWITIDNRMIHVQDLEPEHAKNIIRMMLRSRRESMIKSKEMLSQLESAITGMMQDIDQSDSDAPVYLH